MTLDQIAEISAVATACENAAIRLRILLAQEPEPEEGWAYPVGSCEYPTEEWYCAAWHDTTGAKNDGYCHTGIDENVDHYPWGDVDRGQPVWAIASGTVYAAGYSNSYLGGVVIEIEHDGTPLWVRYWHLESCDWKPGDMIMVDDCIGHIGNYTLGAGGDHLHLDMARNPFQPHWWFTKHPDIRWIDPVPVLKAHLDPAVVDAMLKKKK